MEKVKAMAEKKVKKAKKSGTGRPKLRVSDLIITDEFTVVPITATGKTAAEKLMEIPRGVVIVVNEDKKAEGVITAREFLKCIVEGNNPVKLGVTRLMNKDIMEIKYHTALDNVVPKVRERDPYAVIVVDKEGKLKGYFSPKDYQEALARINYVPPM